MTGVDYSQLRGIGASLSDGGDAGLTFDPATGDGGFDRAVIDAYADGFIGDYVAKLRNFVDYYNVQYPSHQGDDNAILSLREDFLERDTQCVAHGANLLYYSSQLSKQAVGDALHGGDGGWELHPCISDGKCLAASLSEAPPSSTPPADALRANVSVLVDGPPPLSLPISGPDGGIADASVGDAAGGSLINPRGRVNLAGPAGFVSQSVRLDAGTYVLSWWDQARAPRAGMPLSTEPYRVTVFDDSWNAMATFSDAAFVPASASDPDWSARRVLALKVSASGTYHVAFAASGTGTGNGAVAISGVQLEKTNNNGLPTSYIETNALLDSYTALCPPPSAGKLQAAFTRKCDNRTGACFYELYEPIVLDAVALQRGTSPLAGKIARDNFNYRHVNVALNLVGTGVRSCPDGASQSCYGSGYTEYSLYHDAEQVPILDWNGTAHYFDFETGRVEHGKALSAERYITLPLGSADQSLISQPGIQKVELQGRPLDGRYRLRIWDNPALRWDRLEDIQIVLQYRYWSKVDRSTPSSN